MRTDYKIVKPFLLVCLLTLAAAGCSDSSNPDIFTPPNLPGDPTPDPTPGPTVSGTAEAPGGSVARFEHNNSFFYLALNSLVIPVYADVLGLQPVGGATVELIRIDDDGNQVGAVLASTVTSSTGEYSLQLPSGVSLAANLVVRITGSGSSSMGALVVQQTVNINPISEFVRRKFVDDENLVLADLPLGEVVALQGRAEEFDITASPDFNLAAVLERLEADLGELVENELAVISTTAGGTDAAVGDWASVEFSLAFHDSETADFGSFNMGVSSGTVSISAGDSTGDLVITDTGEVFDAWTNLSIASGNSVPFIHHQTEIENDSDQESFPARIDADGNVIIETPFEEELQTVTIGDSFTDFEGDGPDVGWRWPPSTELVDNLGNNNALLLLERAPAVRFRTVDTNSDQIKDAIDPLAKDGDEVELNLLLVLKQGTNPALGGNYGVVGLGTAVNTFPEIEIFSSVVQAGIDDSTITLTSNDEVSLTRQSLSDGVLVSDESGLGELGSIPYSVADNGLITVNAETIFEGWTNDDGSLFALLTVNSEDTGGENPITTHVEQEILVGIKVPAGLLTLDGAVYRLYPLGFGASSNGATELFSMARSSTLTINSATGATVNASIRSFERPSDTGAITRLAEEDTIAFSFVHEQNGVISMDSDDQLTSIRGFVSEDGKVMVLRLFHRESDNTERLLGIMIAVKQ